MNEDKLTLQGICVWLVCAMFFMYEFFLRTVLGTFQVNISQELHLSAMAFSLISSTSFMLAYSMMQIPVGLIVDHAGLKRSLLAGCITCAFATAGFAFTHQLYDGLLFRFTMGLGAAFGFVCLLVAVQQWMPKRHSGLFIGLSQFIGTLGPMLSAGPLEAHLQHHGLPWRNLFLLLSATALIIAALVSALVHDKPRIHGRYRILRRPETVSRSLQRLFAQWQPWWIALLSACLYFSIEYLSENEGRHFLLIKGASSTQAACLITLSWLGYSLGCPLWGYLSDWSQRRKPVLVLCALLNVIALGAIIYLPPHPLAFLGLGLAASGQTVAFALIAEQFKTAFVAVGLSLNNSVITLLCAFNAPVFSWWLDQVKAGHSDSAISQYTIVFNGLLVLALLAVCISTMLIRESFCKCTTTYHVLCLDRH